MTYKEIFELELSTHGIRWCRRCVSRNSHARGYAVVSDRIIHLDSEISTRSTLYRGLHEIGHLVRDQAGMRRHEKERQANEWAERRLRELGIPVPRRMAARGKAYVARMKRWGKNIAKGRRA